MSISEPFIRRPIATTLLTLAIALAGTLAFNLLPVASLPQVDSPTISISGSLPGASPEIVASSIATPLERELGHIAAVTEMTSSSSLGSTNVTLQFDLNRNIDAAARDVEAAINAARSNLPANLPSNPSYRKVNPSDAPILIIALTSSVLSKGQMYDAASTVLAQKISQVDGVGQVTVGGSSLPGVRVELNPTVLNKYNIGLEDVRTALSNANSNKPKGHFADATHTWTVDDNDQLFNAVDYRPLIVAYRNGAPVRVGDVADVVDSVEDIHTAGYANGKPSVLLIISREPGANIIETVDRVLAMMPSLHNSISPAVDMTVILDRTTTIRASILDVEETLIIAIVLVIIVVFVFLRDFHTMIIPAVAVPVSLVGTFGVMYLLGFSLDNLSLMAMTISTGFVVDDAIVVTENITRHIEKGLSPLEAALLGSKEIGFTVLSISLSLVAVFIPILLMGGLVGRLFREFAVTLTVAILVSMVISLTTTPMMCALLLKPETKKHGRVYMFMEWVFDSILHAYEYSLHARAAASGHHAARPHRHHRAQHLSLLRNPQGLLPATGHRPFAGFRSWPTRTPRSMRMNGRFQQMIKIVLADKDVDNLAGFTGGGGGANTGRMFITLKPLAQRKSADLVIADLRPKLAKIPGATLYLQSQQELRVGARQGNALYQYTLQSDNFSRSRDVGAEAPRAIAKDPDPDRREQRPAAARPAIGARLRPRHGQPLRHLRVADRQHALRRLRPAAGLDHVHLAQPVPRRHGSLAGVRAQPRCAAQYLHHLGGGSAGAAQRAGPLSIDHRAADDQSPGAVLVRHHLVQSRARRSTGRCGQRHQRREADDRLSRDGARRLRRHGAGLPGLARQ